MKRVFITCIGISTLLFLTHCAVFRNPVDGEKVLKLYKDQQGNVNITGNFTVEDLQERASFSEWYTTEYNNYVISDFLKNHKSDLKKSLKGKSIQIFIGTWCSDSKREVPRFMKIMDFLKIPKSKIQLVGVNREKHAFAGQDIGKRIKRVPTFIFYQNQFADRTPTEVGRIVEYPVETLEKDMLKILSGDFYVPNYANE